MTHRSAYDDAERRYADRVAAVEEYGPTPCPSCGNDPCTCAYVPECDGLCVTAYDVGVYVKDNPVAYAHPACPLHGDGEPEIPEHILAHDDRCGAVTGGICDCREWERFDEDRRDPDDDRDECDCLAAEEDGHKADEHKSCGKSMETGAACGGCHSCIEAQISYYQRQQPIDVPGAPPSGEGQAITAPDGGKAGGAMITGSSSPRIPEAERLQRLADERRGIGDYLARGGDRI